MEDWEEERRKRKEALDREEQERQDRVKRAKRLENSRKLSNLCREYIKENSQTRRDREDNREKDIEVLMGKERTQVTKYKKGRYVKII